MNYNCDTIYKSLFTKNLYLCPLKYKRNMNDEKLFTEFPPVTTEQWEATINKDLKGADYEKKLVWRTDEGFQVRPYYRAENLQDLDYLKTMPNEFPYTRGTKARDNHWDIVQEVEESDPAKANAIATDALKRGATCVAFNAANIDSDAALETLLKDIDLNTTGVQFNHVKSYLDLMKRFVSYVEAHNFDKEKVSGSINFDPLSYRLRHNKFWKSAEEDMQQAVTLLEMNGCMKNFKVINVNGIVLHNAGATIVQELAYTLSMANEYLAFCTEKGLKPEKVASRMQLTLSVGSNYFMEIAKLRATRLLWSTMVAQYKPECDCAYKIHINTVASTWNKTLYDPYVNMLRSTTEGMSAAIGGSDSISLQPFDVAYKESDEFSRRISRNVQVILKEEAFMDRVVDPAAGSYYVENLTNSIAENAWKLFQSVEQQERVKKDDCEGLKTYRGAMAFEEVRLETEKYAAKNHRPSVFLLKVGNLAMRQARAGFITNFFGCAGYQIIEPAGFPTVEEGVKAAGEAKPDLIVVCSSDEEYATLGVEAAKQCKAQFPNTPFLVAGNPTECLDALKEAGTDDFIHVRVNILESLRKYNQLLLK